MLDKTFGQLFLPKNAIMYMKKKIKQAIVKPMRFLFH